MRPTSFLEIIDHPLYDTVIVWDDGARLVAIAYQDGRVKTTRPVENVAELASGFQIRPEQVASTTQVQATARPVISTVRARW